MKNEKKFGSDQKKGTPGSFLFFLVAMILVFFALQALLGDKGRTDKVSFGYQLEHLINLDLVDPESSYKIAQNDNLVLFGGKFREQLSEEGKGKFSYLELLSKSHMLTGESKQLAEEIENSKKNVSDAASWFLQIIGKDVPERGFTVVGPVYDTFDRQNSIVIQAAPSRESINLKDLTQKFSEVSNASVLKDLEKDLSVLVQFFRSPKLGVGNEQDKKQLKEISENLLQDFTTLSFDEQKKKCQTILTQLQDLSDRLMKEEKSVRLFALRSVRNYVENVEQYAFVHQELEKNQNLLENARQSVSSAVWFFNDKELSTNALEKQDPEVFSNWFAQAKQEWDHFVSNKGLAFKAPDQPRSLVLEKTFKSQEPSPNYVSYIFTLLPVVLIVFVLYFIFARQMKGVGSSAMNFGKSPAKLLTKETNKIMFRDVAGAEEAKEELKEIVDFLKDPQKFTALGARIPKGVLLVGPPGTGKTLIAKAVAGEADRPFFSISGSDFVEMFVGVGASRIRDLFDQAKKNSPCIIFMDEIDAVGRHRGAGIGGGHDEREQTLNQLLVEMDGFDTKEGVILMAATNRPDVLDRALLRPGRFDRRVVLDLPDVRGRFEILKVHARRIKIDPSVELMDIAKSTPGASGADLENILNEAALMAARRGRSAVTNSEMREACDKVRYGKERRSLEMDENEKRTTAYHESGHAVVGLTVKTGDPVDKVTIIPRGFSLGATHFMPKKNRLSYWRKEILDQLTILLGGRVAEEIFVQDISSGAQQDIAQATKLARAMVCEWGMSEALGTISYDEKAESGQYLGMANYHEKLYSEETAQKIDKEVFELVQKAHERARQIVEEKKDKVQLMTDMLFEFETLDATDVKEIIEGTWNVETKRKRLSDAEKLQKIEPPPVPQDEKTHKKKRTKEAPPTPQET